MYLCSSSILYVAYHNFNVVGDFFDWIKPYTGCNGLCSGFVKRHIKFVVSEAVCVSGYISACNTLRE